MFSDFLRADTVNFAQTEQKKLFENGIEKIANKNSMLKINLNKKFGSIKCLSL